MSLMVVLVNFDLQFDETEKYLEDEENAALTMIYRLLSETISC